MEELKTLIVRARESDVDAYGAVVRRFQDMAVGYAYSVLGDFHLAEDAAQEAFIQAYLDLPKLHEPAAFAGWFRRIVFKHCDRIRRKKRVPVTALDEAGEIGTDERNPAELLEEADAKRQMLTAIQTLPKPEREVLSLFYIGEFSQSEVAAFLELPVTTVNFRLHSSRKRLKQELTKMAKQDFQEQRPSQSNAFAGRIEKEIKALEKMHAELTPVLQPMVAEAMGRPAKVEITGVNQGSYGEFVDSLERHSCTYFFNMEPMRGWVVLDLSMPLSLAVLGRFKEGEEVAQEAEIRQWVPDDQFSITRYHIQIVNQLVKRIMAELEAAWKPVLPVTITNPQIETSTPLLRADARMAAPDEEVVHVVMEVEVEGFRDLRMRLCYPVSTLETALPLLGEEG